MSPLSARRLEWHIWTSGLDGMRAIYVTHPGHSPDRNGLEASYLGRDGASPSKYPLLVMILGNGNISDGCETETPAVDLLMCDREEEPDPTSSHSHT